MYFMKFRTKFRNGRWKRRVDLPDKLSLQNSAQRHRSLVKIRLQKMLVLQFLLLGARTLLGAPNWLRHFRICGHRNLDLGAAGEKGFWVRQMDGARPYCVLCQYVSVPVVPSSQGETSTATPPNQAGSDTCREGGLDAGHWAEAKRN